VIITDCELFGRTPCDQFVTWSQLPLTGLIHEFTWAEAAVANAIASAAKPMAGFNFPL
jgi:hypothetical protein